MVVLEVHQTHHRLLYRWGYESNRMMHSKVFKRLLNSLNIDLPVNTGRHRIANVTIKRPVIESTDF